VISSILILICGAILVAWSSNKAVRCSLELASMLHVKTFVVGFIVLSLSTSLPELSVAIMSGIANVPGLSVGNIVGANFIDLSLILGLVVIIAGEIRLERKDELDLVTIFAIATLVMLLIFTGSSLTRAQGVVLIGIYVVSIAHIYSREKLEIILREERDEAKAELKTEEFLISRGGTLVKLLSSLLILAVASKVVVDSAVSVATFLNLPKSVIGATLVAIGTTLPEFSLELQAMRREEYALALGDCFGSALTNSTLVLGVLSILSPSHIEISLLAYLVPLLFAVLFIIWSALIKRKKIDRRAGIALIVVYLMFLLLGAAELILG